MLYSMLASLKVSAEECSMAAVVELMLMTRSEWKEPQWRPGSAGMLEWPCPRQTRVEGALGRTARAWPAWSSCCWPPWLPRQATTTTKKRRNGFFGGKLMLRLQVIRQPLVMARMLSTSSPTPTAHVPDHGTSSSIGVSEPHSKTNKNHSRKGAAAEALNVADDRASAGGL